MTTKRPAKAKATTAPTAGPVPTASGLPRGLELLWGLGGGARGPRPGLTVEGIVAAAVAVADADGLGAVSMARVAAELGFTTMSLYRYVTSKDELLVLMMDGAIGGPPTIAGIGHDWRADLAAWARAMKVEFLAHAWVLQIPIAGPVMTPNQLGWLDRGLHALADTGLTEDEKAALVLQLSGFVRNEVTLRVELERSEARLRETTGDEQPPYGRIIARLVDPGRLPYLQRVIDAGVFDDEGGYGDADFEFGLERVLDGFGVLIDQRTRARSGRAVATGATSRASKRVAKRPGGGRVS